MLVDGHLGCFYFLDIMTSNTLNTSESKFMCEKECAHLFLCQRLDHGSLYAKNPTHLGKNDVR